MKLKMTNKKFRQINQKGKNEKRGKERCAKSNMFSVAKDGCSQQKKKRNKRKSGFYYQGRKIFKGKSSTTLQGV